MMPMMTCLDGCKCEACEAERTAEYRENLAQIAEALMESTARHCPGWHPADCPSEIVVDLVNERDELAADARNLRAELDRTGGDLRCSLTAVVEWWDGLPPRLRQDIEGSGFEPGCIAVGRRLSKQTA